MKEFQSTERERAEKPEESERTIAPGKTTLTEVSRKADGDNGVQHDAEEKMDDAFASSGSPLPGQVRRKFEGSLGVDLGGVRVHDDAPSADAASSMSAKAYTVGQDIHFNEGQYDAGSSGGEELLAHEVAHTVQQQGTTRRKPQFKLDVSTPGDSAEVEADTAASAMVQGAPALIGVSSGAVSREVGGANNAAPAPAAGAGPAGAVPAGPAPGLVGAPTQADITAAETFAGSGPHGPQSVVPSTGLGGFDATYTPTAAGPGVLNVSIHAAVNFVDPITAGGGGTAVATSADYQPMADALNALDPAQRAAAIPQFSWSTAAAERQSWMDRLKASVEATWSQKHEFHIQRAGWDWIGSTVSVVVTVAARAARDPSDHLAIDAVKTPPDTNLYSYGMYSYCAEGSHTDAHDQSMRISSNDVDARPDDLLATQSVNFGNDSFALDGPAQTALTGWIQTFQGDPTNPASHAVTIDVEGFASRSGSDAHNQTLSQQRVASVVDFMTRNGFTNVASRVSEIAWGESFANQAADTPNDRRVDITIQHGGAQVLAAHEFGHAFGLGDQYATSDTAGNPTNISGTGAQTGGAADHDALTKKMMDDAGAHLPGAIYENNEGIMSGGNSVMAEHYSTFNEALRTVSGVADWALGPPHDKAAIVAAAGGGSPAPSPSPSPAPAPAPAAT